MTNRPPKASWGNPPCGGALVPVVSWIAADGEVGSIFPELADTIAVTEMRIAAAVVAASALGSVIVRFVDPSTGHAVSQVCIA